jgi:type II secretory pathway component GspD/PulD (secretin)
MNPLVPFVRTGSSSPAFDNTMSDLIVPNINIPEKLALPILELNLQQQSLIEFIRVMSRLTGIPITLDIDEMKPLALSVKTLVSGQFKEVTAEQIFTETLAGLGLQWKATDRQILILPKATAGDIDLTFDISDFAGKTNDLPELALKGDILAEMVRRLVCPEANVEALPDNRLAVTQNENSRKSPRRQRDDVQRFLEQLRAVRKLPPKTELREETLAPEVFGWEKVIEPMTLNYYQPVPLSEVLKQLEKRTELTIIVDHQSLHRALSPFAELRATVQCNQGTINDILELSLASVDSAALTYRIIDHQTLEITTVESARQPEKMVMEVHRYQLGEDEMPEDVVRSLRLAVEPESWEEGRGDIMIDVPSSCLFVRQSQPAHRQIRLFFSEPEPLAP